MGLFRKAIVFLNSAIGIFSAAIFIYACVTIRNFDRENEALFSRGDFGWLLFGGLVGMFVAILGCLGSRDPVERYNLLFCYFFLLSVMLGTMIMGFYLYRVFVKDLETTATGDVENAFRLESAKEFNDLLLSVYVFCCSGCNQTIVPECVRDITPFERFDDNCDLQNLGALGESLDDVSCLIPTVCNEAQKEQDNGLGQGCTINAPIVPSYELGDNFCIFFSEFATNKNDKDIVGSAEGQGCGGGDPVEFVRDVFEFMTKRYLAIASLWGIGIIFVFTAWVGALFMLLCPYKYDDEVKH